MIYYQVRVYLKSLYMEILIEDQNDEMMIMTIVMKIIGTWLYFIVEQERHLRRFSNTFRFPGILYVLPKPKF